MGVLAEQTDVLKYRTVLEKKERRCLRCNNKFMSAHRGNRLCNVCSAYIDSLPVMAGKLPAR